MQELLGGLLMAKYLRRLESKYLISGPSPVGRVLNYIKRIKEDHYRTSERGPRRSDNLDDWTVCLMVGLGLINEPKRAPSLNITLTAKGKNVYNLIRNLPDFPDNPNCSRSDMLLIKNQMLNTNPRVYKLLKNVLTESDAIRNLLSFIQEQNAEIINKEEFKKFGRIFGIKRAWFNRVPSLLQILEFCDILRIEPAIIRVVSGIAIRTRSDLVKESLMETKRRQGQPGDLDVEEEDLLRDVPKNISPKRIKRVVEQIQHDSRISKRLKALYQNRCQICGFTFAKKDGGFYSESHHVIPLGRRGSDEIRNIIIVCPNCHRQLHYADVKKGSKRNNKMLLKINNVRKYVNYHPRHFQALTDSDL